MSDVTDEVQAAAPSASPWPAAVAGATSIFNTFSNILTNERNIGEARRIREQNLEQARLFRDNDRWYNSPLNQRLRMEEAGLNPNLLYGLPPVTSDTSAPNSFVAQAKPYYLDPLTAAQVANIQADTEQKRANTDLTRFNLSVGPLKFELDKDLTQAQTEAVRASVDEIKAQTEVLLTQADNNRVQWQILSDEARIKAVDAWVAEQTADEQVRRFMLDNNIKETELAQMMQEYALYPALVSAKLTLMKAQAGLANAQATESSSRTTLNYANTILTAVEIDGKLISNEDAQIELGLKQDPSYGQSKISTWNKVTAENARDTKRANFDSSFVGQSLYVGGKFLEFQSQFLENKGKKIDNLGKAVSVASKIIPH